MFAYYPGLVAIIQMPQTVSALKAKLINVLSQRLQRYKGGKERSRRMQIEIEVKRGLKNFQHYKLSNSFFLVGNYVLLLKKIEN